MPTCPRRNGSSAWLLHVQPGSVAVIFQKNPNTKPIFSRNSRGILSQAVVMVACPPLSATRKIKLFVLLHQNFFIFFQTLQTKIWKRLFKQTLFGFNIHINIQLWCKHEHATRHILFMKILVLLRKKNWDCLCNYTIIFFFCTGTMYSFYFYVIGICFFTF
jgi:hypothetical protein